MFRQKIEGMLINDKYLKEYSPIPLNFDITELRNYIRVAEKIWLLPIIGEEMYEELDEQVGKNEISEENATLFVDGGLYQYLAFATVLEGLPILWANFSAVGITLGKSDNSDSITLKDLTLIQNHIRNQVEVLKDLLIKWLESHWESFPKYHSTHCGCSSCCAKRGRLNEPNPRVQLYRTYKVCNELR